MKNRKHNRKCIVCSTQIDDRSKSGLCKKCCQGGKLNGFYGKRHSQETKLKMRKKAKERDKATYYKIPATKEIISKRESIKKINWNKLSIEEKHKILDKFIKAGKKRKGTRIEVIIKEILNGIGMVENVDYQTNIYINGFNVDFLVYKKFIIECYGDYWHRNPRYFNEPKDKERRQKDLKRKRFLENKGYKFMSFWETEIYSNLDKIKKRLEIILNLDEK